MNSILRFIRTAALTTLVALVAASASAQTTLTNTTLAAAVSGASDQSITITSATGWTASSAQAETYALVDREVLGIRAISGTVLSVTRGRFGTRATGHANGATIYFVNAALSPVVLNQSDRAGACSTAGNADLSQNGAYVPVFNPATGRAFYCLGSTWVLASDYGGVTRCSVTQATSKSTGVTCSSSAGTITLNGAALAAGAEVGFTVTNTHVRADDVIALSIKSGATADSYQYAVDAVAAGSFRVNISNLSAGSLSEAVVLNFKVVKD